MISRRLRTRRNCCGTFFSRSTTAAAVAKLHPHQERAFLLLRWIQYGLSIFPRTATVTQSGIISVQVNSHHPSVPEAEVALAASPWDAAAGFGSAWMCAPREMTTVEIACLKMSCS